jgi:hypothetical protein
MSCAMHEKNGLPRKKMIKNDEIMFCNKKAPVAKNYILSLKNLK